MKSDEFEPFDVEPTEKPSPRLTSYSHGMLSGVGGFRSLFHLFHAWRVVKNTGKWRYDRCAVCTRRRIIRVCKDGAQPVDYGWLDTGEWTKIGPPPRQGSAVKEQICEGARGGKSKFLQSAIEDVADKATAHFMQQVDELLGKMRSEVLPDQPSSKLKEAVISVLSAWKNGYFFDPAPTMRMVAEKKLEILESALRSEK